MSENEIKYPVGYKKTAHDVQLQMGRITEGLARRVRRLEQKGNLYSEGGIVGLKTTTYDGTPKMLEAEATKRYNKNSSYLRKKVGHEGEQTSLNISSVAADTMHGWILKGTVTDPEGDVHKLAGDETVHHLALSMAELRNEIANQETINKKQTQVITVGQDAKNAALKGLYR